MAPPGAIKTVDQLTAPLCPGGAPENSPAFQRRVSEPKETSVPKGRLRATSILSRPFGTRVSVLASPALKRRAISGCPSGTKLQRRMPDAWRVQLPFHGVARAEARLARISGGTGLFPWG